jgi:tRNA pseudouridine55 synthase
MDGVLIIDKPPGLTSHDVVARVRRILDERRVGHTGTLDPFATGVLIVLVGRATRLAQFLSADDKEYEAVIRFGFATDTGDLTGTPLSEEAADGAQSTGVRADTQARPYRTFSDQEIESALASLRGEIAQVPPMYSAKKHQGQKLYELARRGETLDRKPVKVTVYEIAALQREGVLLTSNDDGTRDLLVQVVCSAGTYVRVLAQDVGKRLGVGAHLVALRRTRAGDFSVQQAITLDRLKDVADEGSISTILLTPNVALSRMPFMHLTEADARRTRNGMGVRVGRGGKWPNGAEVKMIDVKGNLLAVGSYEKAAQLLHPRVVMTREK